MGKGIHWLWFGSLAMTGCATALQPAVLTQGGPEAHAELESIVSQAMDGKSVSLADDVLTESNNLIVEQKQHGTIGNNPLMGRRMDRPHHFTLNKNAGKCLLTHDESGEVFDLKLADCMVLSQE